MLEHMPIYINAASATGLKTAEANCKHTCNMGLRKTIAHKPNTF